ncbi:hypothetical protein EA462_05430 [Natrarchaeobius halalkaliphilus]|uniref:Uncharacterized protein n=1 Tax=Natrarchaeobius halalkaliphilus TaxID=1679091 RepID=A0A3N6LUX6_9EURY|nr:hypothetical protein [Natrarchaeobius halalkaliphilus]RQG91414.1 hypothetical protein EA462_05430 [Natrarchaeobius halalkaliphilus]
METLEITDEQYEVIQQLREEMSESVVGKYGFVREQDVVQFLLDNLDEETQLADEVDLAPDDSTAAVDADGPVESGSSEREEVTFDETARAATDSSSDSSSDNEDENAGDEDADDGGNADDDDLLNEMMSLLETHDDKWEESSSADYRYTVTLPDGSSEDVQTKDDVRALLFKNY